MVASESMMSLADQVDTPGFQQRDRVAALRAHTRVGELCDESVGRGGASDRRCHQRLRGTRISWGEDRHRWVVSLQYSIVYGDSFGGTR